MTDDSGRAPSFPDEWRLAIAALGPADVLVLSCKTHESGCGRCVFFAVDHNGGLFGWLKVLALFAWHRASGRCVPFVDRDDPSVTTQAHPPPKRRTDERRSTRRERREPSARGVGTVAPDRCGRRSPRGLPPTADTGGPMICPGMVSMAQVDRIRAQLDDVFPGRKVLILSDGLELSIVAPSGEADQ